MRKIKKYQYMVLMIIAVIMTAAIVTIMSWHSIAAGETIVCSKTADGSIYLYVKVNSDIMGGVAQIGNVLCDDITIDSMSDVGIPVQTIFLLDNSISLSDQFGSQAKEIMLGIVDNHMDGEQFRVTTFSNELFDLSDFSNDYEYVKSLIAGIQYNNQNTYLTDTLYNLLEEQRSVGAVNYLRLIVITDGADDNDITYTQAELTDLMRNCNIPIHTIGVQGSNNESSLEQLFSYSRITKGTYYLADKNSSQQEILDGLSAEYDMSCIRIVPDELLLDGSTKEIMLTLNTSEGDVVLMSSVKMPFGTSMPLEPEISTELEELEAEPEMSESLMESAVPETEQKERSLTIWMIAACLVLVAVIVVVALLKGKKKKGIEVSSMITSGKEEGGTKLPAEDYEKTILLNSGSTGHNKTEMLWGNMNQGVRHSHIVLTSTADPSRVYRVPIGDKIRIGRKHADIVIDFDHAVSSQHCEIIKRGKLYYINDLNSSNGTYYDGMRISGETAMRENGTIQIGRQEFKVAIEE